VPLVPIDMRQKPFFFRSDRRIYDVDRDVGILQRPAVEESHAEVDDPDPINLVGRLHRTFPDSHPSSLGFQLKVREVASDGSVLLINA
jgi:hypothetical protein